MKKLFFLTVFICLALNFQAQRLMNGSRSTVGYIENGRVMNGSRSTIGYVENGRVMNGSRSTIGYIENGRVMNGSRSTIGYIENGRVMNGWSMTGGVTIFNSLVEMKHCYFTNFLTEDALNIVSSQFHLEKCTFKDIYSDAFDGDFVTGKIKDCDFSIIGGDGVDFSGSNARIVDCNFSNISDKAVSIGEASKVEVVMLLLTRISPVTSTV